LKMSEEEVNETPMDEMNASSIRRKREDWSGSSSSDETREGH